MRHASDGTLSFPLGNEGFTRAELNHADLLFPVAGISPSHFRNVNGRKCLPRIARMGTDTQKKSALSA
jgi:hypothetical protein